MDIVFIPGWFSHQDGLWDIPAYRAFHNGLAEFARVISYDKRGTGMSDPIDRTGAFTDRLDDLRAIMAVTEARRPHLVGLSEGGWVAVLQAGTEPETVASLTILGSPLLPHWIPGVDEWPQSIRDGWGEGVLYESFLPELRGDPQNREIWARLQRLSASRGIAQQYLEQLMQIDLEPVLPAISAPALVVRGTEDQICTAEMARWAAERIPGARLAEPPCGHLPWVIGRDEVLRTIREFVTGAPAPVPVRRRLATVLFTDIVESTSRAAQLGDRAWRELLDRHDDTVRAQLSRFGGREIKSTGDGFLASFDGPADAIDCARSAKRAVADFGLETRAGIHMGQCEVRGDDLGGIAVHIGARVASLAAPGEVLVSRTVRDLVAGSDVELVDRGEHVLKGVDEPWRVFAVVDETLTG